MLVAVESIDCSYPSRDCTVTICACMRVYTYRTCHVYVQSRSEQDTEPSATVVVGIQDIGLETCALCFVGKRKREKAKGKTAVGETDRPSAATLLVRAFDTCSTPGAPSPRIMCCIKQLHRAHLAGSYREHEALVSQTENNYHPVTCPYYYSLIHQP